MPDTTSHFHPGIILRPEFFEPLGLTQVMVAAALGIPPNRLSALRAGRRALTRWKR